MRSSEVADFPRGFFLNAPAIKSSQSYLVILQQKTKQIFLSSILNRTTRVIVAKERWKRSIRFITSPGIMVTRGM